MSYLDKILKKAEKEHDYLKHPYVGTEHLLLAILSEDNEFTTRLKEYKLSYNKFKRKLKEVIGEGSKKSPYILYTPMLRRVINDIESYDDITNIDIFKSLLNINEGIAIRIIETMDIKIDDIKNIFNDYMIIDEDNIISHRDKEIEMIFQVLMRKNKCNPLLLGDAGVGKSAIVEEIQRRLLNEEIPNSLKGYKIIQVDMSSLVSGTKYRGDFESKINKVLKNAENTKSILFIDEIHTLVHAGGAEGAIAAGDIIKPYLARGKIKCIGATTINEYHEYFDKDDALSRRFQVIFINEPNFLDTVDILNNLKNSYEKYHKLKIDNYIIKETVTFSNKFITNKKNPDKSIELLDSCCTNAIFNEQKNVTLKNLYNVINYRYGIYLDNKYIREILEDKAIISTSKDNIKKIETITCNVLKIDGDKYNCEEDMLSLLGNPVHKNKYYLLKNIIDNPLGIVTITNYNYNSILKEFIQKLLNTRHILDNLGNDINFDNYIIVIEKVDNDSKIGFENEIISKLKFIEWDEKKLLTAN